MPVTPPTIPAGRLEWAPIAAAFEATRTWLNGIVSDDVQNGAVQREHLVRPVLGGFPLDGMAGEFQGLFRGEFGVAKGDIVSVNDWGPLPERLVVIPEVVAGRDGTWYLPVGRTVYCPTTRDAELDITFQVHPTTRTPPVPEGGGGPDPGDITWGPTAAHAGELGGYFSIHHVWREDTPGGAGEQEQSQSRRHVVPTRAGDGLIDRVAMRWNGQLTPGTHDLVLVYHRAGATDGLWQLDLTRIATTLEVL